MELSEQAKKARNDYQREYRRKHPGKQREYMNRYWERKADPVGTKARQLSEAGMSQRDIAEQLNISLGTVNNILNRS